MLDSHTHSHYSMDSETPTDALIDEAIARGLSYIAVTDHLNLDYFDIKEQYRANSKELMYPLDVQGHIDDISRARAKYGDAITIGMGIECGYSESSQHLYDEILSRGEIDVVINSVHTIDREDIYDQRMYNGKSREWVLRRYLELIRESVDASYNYNIIGHIGYLSRRAPYENHILTMDEFGEEIDDILRAIIVRDKCLECNSKSKNTPLEFLPGTEILTRYYELGGRRISFGSDSHDPSRLGEKYDRVREIAKSIGFEGFTYYIGGEPQLERF